MTAGAQQSADSAGQEPVGSLAEEAARFAEALSDWAARHGGPDGLGERLVGAANGLGQHVGHGVGAGFGAGRGAAEQGASALAGLTALLGGLGEGVGAGVGGGFATGSPDCRLCPLCQLVGILRGTRPEVYDHLAAAVTSLVAALREAVAASERDWAYRRRGGLQRIDIG
ncbi:MAG: DUF5304 family protein [Motilibacteraceae bacterium]